MFYFFKFFIIINEISYSFLFFPCSSHNFRFGYIAVFIHFIFISYRDICWFVCTVIKLFNMLNQCFPYILFFLYFLDFTFYLCNNIAITSLTIYFIYVLVHQVWCLSFVKLFNFLALIFLPLSCHCSSFMLAHCEITCSMLTFLHFHFSFFLASLQ